MSSKFSREQIAEKLNEVWLKDAQNQMLGLLEQETLWLTDIIQQAAEQVRKGEPENAIRELAASFETEILQHKEEKTLETDVPKWLQELKGRMHETPGVISLPQQEERFRGTSTDSPTIVVGKIFKWSARTVQSGWVTVGNGLRKISKRKSRKATEWKQQIPLKNIISYYLFDIDSWLLGWKNELKKIESELLLESDAWLLHSSGLIQHQETDAKEGESAAQGEINYTPSDNDIMVFLEKAAEYVVHLKKAYVGELQVKIDAIANEINRAVQVTDTIERSGSEYSDTRLQQKTDAVSQKLSNDASTWQTLQNALVNRVLLTMEFRKLYEQASERTSGFSHAVEQFFDANIIEHQQTLLESLEEAISVFVVSEAHSIQKVRELSTAHQQKMSTFVEDMLLKPLREHVEQATLSTKLERFTAAVPDWTKEIQEKAVLVEKLDLGQLPPVYEFEKVDWQMLVQRVLTNHLANNFKPKEIKAEQFLQEVSQELQEIAQIIHTNLEIADEVQKSDEEDPIEVAREGLQRAKAKLEEHQQKIEDRKQELVNKLNEKQREAFTKLATLLEEQDVSDVRIAGAEYKARETAVDWKTKTLALWARFSEKGELFARFIWKKLKTYFHTIQHFLGFDKTEAVEEDKTDLATFLSETDEQIARLPFIYRRLFDFDKEVDDHFYIRRPEQFDRFKKGDELWQHEFPSSLALVGEKGSGKSLLIERLKTEIWAKQEVIEINFSETIWLADDFLKRICSALKLEETTDIEEVIAAIHRKRKRVVVILENIQHCYIRAISGFEAIEQMVYLISETNKEILWMTSSTRYAWSFLDKVMKIGDYFTHTAETDKLSAKQIQDLILKRHKASGYQLNFLMDDTTRKSRTFRQVMDDEDKTQEFLQVKYFEKMAKLVEGNASIAMIFWIRSIQEFDDTYFYIKPFDFASISRIDKLESTELFALAAFIRHDSLMPEELAQIMHLSLPESKLMVSRLNSRSIIYRSEQGYMLNHLIYRQVARVLKEANYIH